MRRVVLLLALAAPAYAQEERAPRPNVLFIMADDLGWADLGCQGNAVIRTPSLDALAQQGLRFTDAYAPHPVCSPTRAALMTGQSPARVRITNHIPPSPSYAPPGAPLVAAETHDRMSPDHVTLAEHLAGAGYRCGFFGKWHLMGPYGYMGRGDARCAPDKQGFENNVGGSSYGGPPSFFDPYGIYTLPPREEGEYLPDRLVDEAIDWLGALEEDEPFYLNLWHYAPHWPIEAPLDVVMEYVADLGKPGCKSYTYAAMVTCMDAAIGRLLTALEDEGRAENTLVVFTSDNGGWSDVADLAPLRGSKGFLYEGGIRVPLIVRWPGEVAPGRVSGVPVIGTDLFPTFLTAAGVEVPSPCDGFDLGPLLRGATDEHVPLFWHYPNYAWHGENKLGGAVRDGRWKLIERYADGALELYDLEQDVGEQKNLAGEEPERAQELSAALHAFLEDTSAAMPTLPKR